jgi:hypothetical protein
MNQEALTHLSTIPLYNTIPYHTIKPYHAASEHLDVTYTNAALRYRSLEFVFIDEAFARYGAASAANVQVISYIHAAIPNSTPPPPPLGRGCGRKKGAAQRSTIHRTLGPFQGTFGPFQGTFYPIQQGTFLSSMQVVPN